ncbi:sigma-54-dependent Fis family transcriptional regulator [Dolichospermum sp. UHCC 0259]|uniref:sigma-54-dependent Fis family transcriptional regulator n=1 Tax=Dolichospermum sp. UHCC 0259 TaxID=2590010 RepID=UPI0014485447|nr:sigma-54-dependent Fis family transcriptional regulator [Dolichospermum sp. UHCC 0259]MTJ48237.1 sigma-54-dependent Fis family transcriptional regulator [Dolichospermum sp. UHCC 0259]
MLHLASDALEAGRIYRSTGAIRTEKLRSDIYRAWERSHCQGANPCALQAEKLSIIDTERLLDSQSYLINVVQPYGRILSQAAGTERHAVMLSNQEAILLNVIGDKETVHDSESFPTPGTLLSESVAGANGIGTALAEKDYVQIVSAEHFIEGFHPFSCQGIPLHNDKQEIVGVVSISVRSPDAHQRLKEILICASHGIEAEFLIAKLEKDIRQILASSPDDYQPLEELRQDIIQSHNAARLKLEVVSRMVVVNKLDYAMQLVQQAEKSIQLFRHRADTWRNIASLETAISQPLSLTKCIQDLIDLLATEITIRKVEVITYWQEPINVISDQNSLLRKLLSCFLQAFERGNTGGIVEVKVDKIQTSGLARVSFLAIPALGISKTDPVPYIFTLPLVNNHLVNTHKI